MSANDYYNSAGGGGGGGGGYHQPPQGGYQQQGYGGHVSIPNFSVRRSAQVSFALIVTPEFCCWQQTIVCASMSCTVPHGQSVPC